MTQHQPRNPLYLLLLAVGLLFVVTALAVAFIPLLEQKAIEAGNPPPPAPWRDALRQDGWRWLLYELAALIVLSVVSMFWDRQRSLQKQPPQETISGNEEKPSQASESRG
jgi:hypothetical protein